MRGQRIRAETLNLTWEAARIYSGMLEDAHVQRECAAIREQLLEAQRIGTPDHIIEQLAYHLAHREEHARQHHRMDGVRRVDAADALVYLNASGAWRTINTPARRVSATEQRRRERAAYINPQYWIDEAYEITGISDFMGGGSVGSREANAKGLALLKANLTPFQLAQYETHQWFEVKGGSSGKTYRIKHGRQMNIHELNAKGESVQGWCFLPQGYLCEGDVLLAQKNALELYEDKALKIANRFAVGGCGVLPPNFGQALAQNVERNNPLLQRIAQEMDRRLRAMATETIYGSGSAPSDARGGLAELVREVAPHD